MKKTNLHSNNRFFGLNKITANKTYRLITVIKTMINNVIRLTLIAFPMKISSNRKLNVETEFELCSVEQIKLNIIDSIVNEIAKSKIKERIAETMDEQKQAALETGES